MIDIQPLRDQAWEYARNQETKGWHEYLAAFEKKYAELIIDATCKLIIDSMQENFKNPLEPSEKNF
jgi:hypothetical protein